MFPDNKFFQTAIHIAKSLIHNLSCLFFIPELVPILKSFENSRIGFCQKLYLFIHVLRVLFDEIVVPEFEFCEFGLVFKILPNVKQHSPPHLISSSVR